MFNKANLSYEEAVTPIDNNLPGNSYMKELEDLNISKNKRNQSDSSRLSSGTK